MSTARTFLITATIYATITITDAEAIERITGPGGDEWRSQFYDLHDAEDVAEHFAFNAIMNKVHDVSRLDGWADLDSSAAEIVIDDCDFVVEEET